MEVEFFTMTIFFFIIKCYVGRNDNPSFSEQLESPFLECLLPQINRDQPIPTVGSEPLNKLAHRIWQSVGPSGPNKVSQKKKTKLTLVNKPTTYLSLGHGVRF